MLFCPQLLSFLRIFFLSQRVRNRDWHGLSDWPAKQWDPWETLIVLAFYGTQDNLLARTDGITKTYLWIIVFSSSKKKENRKRPWSPYHLFFVVGRQKCVCFTPAKQKKKRQRISKMDSLFPRDFLSAQD